MDRNTLAKKPYYAITLQAADGSDNTVIYTSADVSWANIHVFESTAQTIDVFVSLDGTNFTTAPVYLEPMHTATNTTHVNSLAADKAGILRGKFVKIKVQNATANQATARIMHGVE